MPKASQSMVATLIRTIFEQPDAEQVWAQHARVVEQLGARFTDAATMLVDAGGESWPSPSSPSSTGQRSAPTTRRSG
jgi:hypothetical protein